MVSDKIIFKAQKNAPSPKEVDYWIDTTSNPNGGEMKYYNGSKWAKVGESNSSGSNLEYEFVDLGLPSGLKWATCNLGATKPEEYGLYYAWGETEGRTGRDEIAWADYKFSIDGSSEEFSKYNLTDNKITLDFVDDAAHQIDSSMRMPTSAEWKELINNVNKKWETVNGVDGVRLTSKTNGNSIFIPRYNVWSSSRYSGAQPQYAYDVEINSYQLIAQNYHKARTKTWTIRPVQESSVPFNPNKYYTKEEIDAKFAEITAQLNNAE